MEALKDLEGKLAALRAKDKPRGKFTFSTKATASGTATIPVNPPAPTSTAATDTTPSPPMSTPGSVPSNQYSLDDLAGQRITPSLLTEVKGEYTLSLSNITDSIIDLRPSMNASATLKSLHVSKLDRCVLITDGMSGSAMLHDCSDCALVLGAHQASLPPGRSRLVHVADTSSACTHLSDVGYICTSPPHPSSSTRHPYPSRRTPRLRPISL